MMIQLICYLIVLKDFVVYLFEVMVMVVDFDFEGQCFLLLVWILGSYFVCEFVCNIVMLCVFNDVGCKVCIVKIDKYMWQVVFVIGVLMLCYDVYVWDLLVCFVYFDELGGFFNVMVVFLSVVGCEDVLCEVDIVKLVGVVFCIWCVGIVLFEVGGIWCYGFGVYCVVNYDELFDYLVMIGEFVFVMFDVYGVLYDIVIVGCVMQFDLEWLCNDLKWVCEVQIVLFELKLKKVLMECYVFMMFVVSDGYGGFEYCVLIVLICNCIDLLVKG